MGIAVTLVVRALPWCFALTRTLACRNFEAKRVAHDALRIFHDRSDEKGETVANEVLAHLKTVITELPALLSEENRVPLQPTLPKQVTSINQVATRKRRHQFRVSRA